MFGNYTHEFKYSLKEQERSNRTESTALLQTHINETSKEMPQGKYYQKFPKTPKHRKQTSATRKVYQVSYARKHTQRINEKGLN